MPRPYGGCIWHIFERCPPNGRVTLSERRLITRVGSEKLERELSGEGEVVRVLRRAFGIAAPELVT